MFEKLIASPVSPLTVEYLNSHGQALFREPDYSLRCLGIAVLKPRLENYNGIGGVFSSINDGWYQPIEDAAKSCSAPTLYYFTNVNSEDAQAKERAKIEAMGLKEIPSIKAYVKQELKMLNFSAYTNGNIAVVLAPTSSVSLYHLSLAFLPLYFPNCFKNKPITAEETAIFKSLTNKTSMKFIQLLSCALRIYRAEILKSQLTDLFKGFRERKISAAKDLVDNINTEISRININYQNAMERLEEAILRYEGLKVVASAEENEEVIDYISNSPNLHNVEYHNGVLSFVADTFLINFDPTKWDICVSRKNIYDGYRIPQESPFANLGNRKILLNDLFSQNPKLRVRLRGYIEMNIARSYVDSRRGELDNSDMDPVTSQCLTNPHLKMHSCLGRNRDQIMSCLREGDIVTAIECSVAAVGSVNIGETDLTFRPFLQDLMTTDRKCICRIEDGEYMTPVEALNWLIMSKGAAA